jgi:hypothetical protein
MAKAKATTKPVGEKAEKDLDKMVEAVIKELPDTVQTKDINKVFKFNDGGKYLRRHLRKNFSKDHEHGAPWIWKKEDDEQLKEIIGYLLTKLTPEKQDLLVCVGEDPIK